MVRVLVDLPPAIREAAVMGLADANAAHLGELQGVRLEAVTLGSGADADPAEARRQFERRLEDPSVLAMIGPSDDIRARLLLPLANEANLPVVGANLTAECLTQVQSYCRFREPNSLRPHGASGGQAGALTFFRTCPTEDLVGPTSADYSFDALGRRSAMVIEGTGNQARRYADSFTARWGIKGGTLAGRVVVGPALGSALRAAAAGAAVKPDLVFLAVADPAEVGAVVTALAAWSTEPGPSPMAVLGSPALRAPGAGVVPDRWLATSLAVDAATVAPIFAHAWSAGHGGTAPPPFAYEAYAASQAVVSALQQQFAALVQLQSSALPRRSDVVPTLRRTSYEAEDLGTISFDQGGDNTNRVVTVYRVAAGAWSYKEQLQAGAT
ncbi:MAG: ABC transporter substrate-binding protein [Candidatus Dormibacteria bacterium]